MAICMVFSLSSSEGLAVLIGRDTQAPNEIAPHGLRAAETTSFGDHGDGVVGLLQLPTRGFGADALDIGSWRLADLDGEHPGEVSGAHGSAPGEVRNTVCPTGFELDGLLDVADGRP